MWVEFGGITRNSTGLWANSSSAVITLRLKETRRGRSLWNLEGELCLLERSSGLLPRDSQPMNCEIVLERKLMVIEDLLCSKKIRSILVAYVSVSPVLRSQDPFKLLEIIKNFKELLGMQSYISWYLWSWKLKHNFLKTVY